MKKLTTKQYLIGGGIIALIYILYRKQKSKNGSKMIQDAMSDSKKENDKDYSKPPKVEDGKGNPNPPNRGDTISKPIPPIKGDTTSKSIPPIKGDTTSKPKLPIKGDTTSKPKPIRNGGGGNGLLRDDSIFDSREGNRFDVFFDDSRRDFNDFMLR